MFACQILVVAGYSHCSCSYSFVLATRSKADSSSVYPIERKFAWRVTNSFFKFPSNFFHSHKIFPFICREKFLSSPFTNSATICISKGCFHFLSLNEIFVSMRSASAKKFFSSCCKCSSLHPKRPKGKERCAKPVAEKILAENIGTPMYLSASVRVFVYSKTE